MKHYHPSLQEILNNQPPYEWLSININGFFVGDFADAENERGDISSPSFSLFSSDTQSEYGYYSFGEATISIELADTVSLENLEGKHPLGLINYQDPEAVLITIKLKPEIYHNLLSLLACNHELLKIRVALPKLEDEASKCLPLLKYQVTYKFGHEI